MMRILGVTLGHDSSMALIEDGKIVQVFESERLFREKRYKLHCISLEEGPQLSGYQTVSLDDLRRVLDVVKAEWGAKFQAVAVQNQGRTEEYENFLKLLEAEGIDYEKAYHVDHHLSHASLAFYTSPYADAVVLSYDGTGNDGYTLIFDADGEKGLDYIENNPGRFGRNYNNLGYIIGTRPDLSGTSAGKTMGLTSYGETREDWLPYARRYVREYRKLHTWAVEGLRSYGKGHKANTIALQEIPDLKPYLTKVKYYKRKKMREILTRMFKTHFSDIEMQFPGLDNKDAQDLAKTVQTAWTLEVLEILKKYKGTHKNLCMVGGCALNGITNYEVEETGWFENIHLIPNPSDCGLSAGAALYVYYNHESDEKFTGYGEYFSPYLGFEAFDKDELETYKEQYPHRELPVEQTEALLAKLIYDDLIVGVVRGRYEIGPRALGHRSILCNPLNPDMRDILNAKVKNREWYRPFAPVTTSEDSATYFTNKNDIPYMSMICYTREEYREKLPSITHVDGSARVQTIQQSHNPFLHKTLKEFGKLSGMPILLNTSFNPGGEPILNFYSVALEMLEETGLDMVLIENTLFCKPGEEALLDKAVLV